MICEFWVYAAVTGVTPTGTFARRERPVQHHLFQHGKTADLDGGGMACSRRCWTEFHADLGGLTAVALPMPARPGCA